MFSSACCIREEIETAISDTDALTSAASCSAVVVFCGGASCRRSLAELLGGPCGVLVEVVAELVYRLIMSPWRGEVGVGMGWIGEQALATTCCEGSTGRC